MSFKLKAAGTTLFTLEFQFVFEVRNNASYLNLKIQSYKLNAT